MNMLAPKQAIEKLAQTMGKIPGLRVEASVYEPPQWSVYFRVTESDMGWTALKLLTKAAEPAADEYPILEVGLMEVTDGDRLMFGFCNIAIDVDPQAAEATIRSLFLLANRKGGLSAKGRVCMIGGLDS